MQKSQQTIWQPLATRMVRVVNRWLSVTEQNREKREIKQNAQNDTHALLN